MASFEFCDHCRELNSAINGAFHPAPFSFITYGMPDHERAMLAYARLAEISAQKRQLPGRDRFLILTGAAACRAGWPEVAARCRELVLANNSVHLIGRYSTFADALRSEEFKRFLKQRTRVCSYERAEHLLDERGVPPYQPETNASQSAGEIALDILSI